MLTLDLYYWLKKKKKVTGKNEPPSSIFAWSSPKKTSFGSLPSASSAHGPTNSREFRESSRQTCRSVSYPQFPEASPALLQRWGERLPGRECFLALYLPVCTRSCLRRGAKWTFQPRELHLRPRNLQSRYAFGTLRFKLGRADGSTPTPFSGKCLHLVLKCTHLLLTPNPHQWTAYPQGLTRMNWSCVKERFQNPCR